MALWAWFWNVGPGGKIGFLLKVVRVGLLTVKAFRRHHLGMHASGLAFFLLLAVVPYLAYLLGLLNTFGVSAWLRPQLLNFVAGGNMELVPTIDQFIQNARSGTLGGLGTVFTFALGFMVLQRVKTTLNMIWRVYKPVGYGARLLEYLIALALVPLLLALAFGVTAVFASEPARGFIPHWLMFMAPSRLTASIAGYGVLVAILFYTYYFLPDAKVAWRPALVGALAGAAGVSLVQHYSVVLLVVLSRQSIMYGALAVLPFVMTWFYAAWSIVLAGAQLTYTMQNYREELLAHRHGE